MILRECHYYIGLALEFKKKMCQHGPQFEISIIWFGMIIVPKGITTFHKLQMKMYNFQTKNKRKKNL